MDGLDTLETDGTDAAETGWSLVAVHDGAPAVIGAALELDADDSFTKSELSDAADVPYKTLYLADTLEAIVSTGLLERHEREGEEDTFSVDPDCAVYDAALAFEEAMPDGDPSEGPGPR